METHKKNELCTARSDGDGQPSYKPPKFSTFTQSTIRAGDASITHTANTKQNFFSIESGICTQSISVPFFFHFVRHVYA